MATASSRTYAAVSAGEGQAAVALLDAPSGIALIAVTGQVVYANRRLGKILGYSRDELGTKRLHDLAHPDDVSDDVKMMERLFSGETGRVTLERRYLHKNGSEVWARLTVGAVGRAPGQARCAMAIVDPIPAPVGVASTPAALEHLGIFVYLDRLAVTCEGQPVTATPREVLLLRYFIQHRGEMLSRDQLLTNVWGDTFTGGSRTVDVHVSRLRQKLPPLATTLVTIGNVGYTLIDEPRRAVRRGG